MPEDTTIVDWPIGYKELEPYYDRVEWELGVSGKAGNIKGEIQPQGNPFESTRDRGYPYRRLFKLYSQHSSLPSKQFYVDLDPKVKDKFGQPAMRITHDWTDYDRETVEYFMKIKRKIAQEMGMIDWWEDSPKPAYHISVHDTGTHRMGWDPSSSVVNPFGEVHECKGLYAVGGGQFPTLPSYNPTETIMALAYLTADHLLGRGQLEGKNTKKIAQTHLT